MRKGYSEDFKLQVVSDYTKGIKNTAAIATEYGISKSSVLGWVRKYRNECQSNHTTRTSISNKQLRALNKRIAELEKENLFLKKALAFSAKEIG